MVSPQNVEIKYKNTTKIVNIANVKLKEPTRIVGLRPQSKEKINQEVSDIRQQKDLQYDKVQGSRTRGEEKATATSDSAPKEH